MSRNVEFRITGCGEIRYGRLCAGMKKAGFPALMKN